jgi:hypothetical protein
MTRVDMTETPSTLRPTRSRAEPLAPPGPESIAIFERQVLVFPLLVVVLACASFLFGGRCAAWQWWTAVAAVVLMPFVRKDRRRAALGAAGLFALLLFALRCLIPPLVWDDTKCFDMSVYHLPMIQLLIEGWNPVSDPMAENITASLGLDLWGMAPLHVAFLPKTMAVFSAVAYTFIHDPYALSFPLPAILWLGVLLSCLRLFHGFARMSLIAAIVFILPMVARQMPVDLSLAFASCGLLLAMHVALQQRNCDWFALAVWMFWMMNLKFNGVFGAFVLGALFVLILMWKEKTKWKKWLGRFVAFAGILVLLWGLVSWNPFGTSWLTYGHPLYPFKTIDAERFPIKDLTWDMQLGNQDYRTMGRFGLMAHAFLSPKGTVSFYRWKLGRNDFNPDCEWWHLPPDLPDVHTRLSIWLMFGVLLLLPGGRPWAIGGFILLSIVPTAVIGYTRYQPWLSALGCLAVVLGIEWAEQRLNNRLARLLSAITSMGLCIAVFSFSSEKAADIECKAQEISTSRVVVRPKFGWKAGYLSQMVRSVKHFVPRFNYLTSMENRCRLLVKEVGGDKGTNVVSESVQGHPHTHSICFDERELATVETESLLDLHNECQIRSDNECPTNDQERQTLFQSLAYETATWTKTWILTPFGYYVPDDEQAEHIHSYIESDAYSEERTTWQRWGRGCESVLHAWTVTYPREIWRRMGKR